MALLTERFSFTFHRSTKEGPVYRLEVVRNGPKLVPHGDSERLISTNADGSKVIMRARKISMASLAVSLRRLAGRTVEDHTHLEGEFDFDLVWDRDETADSTVPSLSTALQEQPGLRLTGAKERSR